LLVRGLSCSGSLRMCDTNQSPVTGVSAAWADRKLTHSSRRPRASHGFLLAWASVAICMVVSSGWIVPYHTTAIMPWSDLPTQRESTAHSWGLSGMVPYLSDVGHDSPWHRMASGPVPRSDVYR